MGKQSQVSAIRTAGKLREAKQSVAVQVKNLKKQRLETIFSLHRLKG
jgi:hypothetical protein